MGTSSFLGIPQVLAPVAETLVGRWRANGGRYSEAAADADDIAGRRKELKRLMTNKRRRERRAAKRAAKAVA